ncbi:MAG: hypothetical protein Q8N44_17830 [Rubrivivax sp.]|nr:hypothetical protein [Rubrivivax sp.]
MRWKLLRRRLSISAPRVIVRSHLPWPLRWAAVALVLGFSAALALWAFDFGKEIAGLDRDTELEQARLRIEILDLRRDNERLQVVANTAESLLKAERTAQERLAQQLRQGEAEKLALQADLGFFERLLPASGPGLQLRGLQAESKAPGQLRYQLLVMQNAKGQPDFQGRYELILTGALDGKPWTMALPEGTRPLQLRQYARVEGLIDHPPAAVIKTVQARISDNQGIVRATRTLKL